MKYPMEKYKFIVHELADGRQEVLALSTYAGKTVRGKAICHPNDSFDLETGKKLAALRCAQKIEAKRVKRARNCVRCAVDYLADAQAFQRDMLAYYGEAVHEQEAVNAELTALINDIMSK